MWNPIKPLKSKRARRRAKGIHSPGFTLVEVIITLTILGFILLIIFGTFRLGLSAWEKGESTREEFQKIRVLSQLISQQVKSIVPFKIKTAKAEGNFLAFEGKARSLKFISSLPMKSKQPEGLVYVFYEFQREGKEGGQLILYEQRALNKAFFEERPKEEGAVSLLEGISDIRFEYFREENREKNQSEEWVEEWSGKEEKVLPRSIRMTITHLNGKDKEEKVSLILTTNLPAYQYEEVRVAPQLTRRTRQELVPRTGY